MSEKKIKHKNKNKNKNKEEKTIPRLFRLFVELYLFCEGENIAIRIVGAKILHRFAKKDLKMVRFWDQGTLRARNKNSTFNVLDVDLNFEAAIKSSCTDLIFDPLMIALHKPVSFFEKGVWSLW